jgi:hypothetical protein
MSEQMFRLRLKIGQKFQAQQMQSHQGLTDKELALRFRQQVQMPQAIQRLMRG